MVMKVYLPGFKADATALDLLDPSHTPRLMWAVGGAPPAHTVRSD